MKADPRSFASVTPHVLEQVHYAPPPIGKRKSLIIDLAPMHFHWDKPAQPAPNGIRMQIWNTPATDRKTGEFMRVPLRDFLMTFAEGVEEKEKLSKRHLRKEKISDAANLEKKPDRGLTLVEYQHQFLIQTHRGEILQGDAIDLVRENELVWKAAKTGTCKVYDLRERDHTVDFESKKNGVAQDIRLDVDGERLRRLLRKDIRKFEDKQNRTHGWRLNTGNLLLGFLKDAEDEFEFAIVLPRWIAECMRETYLQALIEILPGWRANFPTPDEWHRDPYVTPTPIPSLPLSRQLIS